MPNIFWDQCDKNVINQIFHVKNLKENDPIYRKNSKLKELFENDKIDKMWCFGSVWKDEMEKSLTNGRSYF